MSKNGQKPAFVELKSHEGKTLLSLSGGWVVANGEPLNRALKALRWIKGQQLEVDGRALEALDTAGAWLLIRMLRAQEKAGYAVTLTGFSEAHGNILDIVDKVEHPQNEAIPCTGMLLGFFITLGRGSAEFWGMLSMLVTFFGMVCVTLLRVMRNPARLRFRSTVYHINEIGIKAVPIVALMAFLIAIVLGYQGAHQLEKFGATMFTVDLVAISMFREMGVLITAIMVAGRSGSAFAAQIGVMQVNEEVDAMRSIGLDPFELLVLPRMLAIIIAMPALTLIADMMGLVGNWFVASMLMDMSWLQFTSRVQTAVTPTVMLIGLGKAPVFAVLIGMVGCLQGMLVEGSADAVGKRTTTAVVHAIFLVILADAGFSVLFTLWGI